LRVRIHAHQLNRPLYFSPNAYNAKFRRFPPASVEQPMLQETDGCAELGANVGLLVVFAPMILYCYFVANEQPDPGEMPTANLLEAMAPHCSMNFTKVCISKQIS